MSLVLSVKGNISTVFFHSRYAGTYLLQSCMLIIMSLTNYKTVYQSDKLELNKMALLTPFDVVFPSGVMFPFHFYYCVSI